MRSPVSSASSCAAYGLSESRTHSEQRSPLITLLYLTLPAATSRFASEANAATFARGQNTAERRSDSEIFQDDPGRTGAIYTAGAAAVDPASTLTGANGNSSTLALGVDGEGLMRQGGAAA